LATILRDSLIQFMKQRSMKMPMLILFYLMSDLKNENGFMDEYLGLEKVLDFIKEKAKN